MPRSRRMAPSAGGWPLDAAGLYREIFERTAGYLTGVNAATMLLVGVCRSEAQDVPGASSMRFAQCPTRCALLTTPRSRRLEGKAKSASPRGGATGGASPRLAASLSEIVMVLKTGSGGQRHSWVRIPPPPLERLTLAWLSIAVVTWRLRDAAGPPVRRAHGTLGGVGPVA